MSLHECCQRAVLALSHKQIVHHIEDAHAVFSRFRREPWRGAQGGIGIGHPLLPAGLHCASAELVVFRRALRFGWAIDELDDVHLGHAAECVEPLGLFCPCDSLRQQFVQFVYRMAHFMLVPPGLGADMRQAGIADILFPLADLFKDFRELAVALEQVNLKA